MYADVVSLSASVFGDPVKQTSKCINQGNGIKLLEAKWMKSGSYERWNKTSWSVM